MIPSRKNKSGFVKGIPLRLFYELLDRRKSQFVKSNAYKQKYLVQPLIA